MDRRLMRVLVGVLWFWAGWGAGNLVALWLGLSYALAPLLGAALGGLIGGDPFHLIWWPKAERHASGRVANRADGIASTRKDDVGAAPSA